MNWSKDIEVFNEDCMITMSRYEDNYFDLAIVDPPYGIGVDDSKKTNFVMTKHQSKNWDKSPPKASYFKELFRVSKKQIIWGGNYFELKSKKGWICWNKENPMKGKFSDFELAWTSFLKCDRMYSQAWIGFGRHFKEKDKSIHPTQKPLGLYIWILNNFSEKNFKIIDTHFGSGSHGIALDSVNKIEKMNLSLVACEIDKDYYRDSKKRFDEKTAWQSIF